MSKNIIEQVKTAFTNILNEIDLRSSEFDIRGRIIHYLIRDVLGYTGKEYQDEKKRTDLTIFDENNFRVLVIETKKLKVDIDTKDLKKYAFKYADPTTKYVGLTNGQKFKLWERIENQNDVERINLDFDIVLHHKSLNPTAIKRELLFFENLKKDILWDESKYADFESYYGQIDIVSDDDEGFNQLINKLDYIINQVLMEYVLNAFDEFQRNYYEYLIQNADLEKKIKSSKSSKSMILKYEKEKMQLEIKYKKYLSFKGYELWKVFSSREESNEETNKDIFCKETIYVMLNKLLFIRICEDKGLLPSNISNGGINVLKSRLIDPEESYKEILNLAYTTAGKLYSHFYELSVLDWYIEGNADLNRVLNRVLWILNRFNFKKVDKDILGKLYQKYLPIEERKSLGEFYTPDEIIDYILNQINYKSDTLIEGKNFLDPACGSGGFLVRAINIIIKRYEDKGLPSEEILNNAISHIYGFDINPFACHITEMNLLFQLIDLYSRIRKTNKNFKMKRFNIYHTDSLKKPKEFEDILNFISNGKTIRFVDEEKIIINLKKQKFDFIAMNPPYVHQKGEKDKPKITMEYRNFLKKNYETVYEKGIKTRGGIKINLFVPFIEIGIKNLKVNNYFGFIIHKNLLKVESYKLLRKFILDNCKIIKIVDLGNDVFKDVTGEVIIIILQKELDKQKRDNNEIIILSNLKDRGDLNIGDFRSYKITQEVFYKTVDYNFTIYIDKEFQELREKIERNSKPLGQIVNITSYGFNIKKGNESEEKKNRFWKKSIRGRDIARYYLKNRNRYAYYHNSVITRKGDVKIFNTEEKIVMQRLIGELIANYDDEKYYCFNSVNMFTPLDEKYNLKYILAILNSELMNLYFKKRFSGFADFTNNITQGYLDPLPIHIPTKQEHTNLITLVNKILGLHKQNIEYNEILNNFELILEDISITKLSEFPQVKFDISSNELKALKLLNNIVLLNSNDKIICENKIIARYIYYYLLSYEKKLQDLKDLKKEIMNIKIPEKLEDIQKILILYKNIKEKLKKLPEEIKKLEENINKAVFSLYKLSDKDINSIKSYLY